MNQNPPAGGSPETTPSPLKNKVASERLPTALVLSRPRRAPVVLAALFFGLMGFYSGFYLGKQAEEQKREDFVRESRRPLEVELQNLQRVQSETQGEAGRFQRQLEEANKKITELANAGVAYREQLENLKKLATVRTPRPAPSPSQPIWPAASLQPAAPSTQPSTIMWVDDQGVAHVADEATLEKLRTTPAPAPPTPVPPASTSPSPVQP